MPNLSLEPTHNPRIMSSLQGSCLCGAVSFALAQTPAEATACHCTQCRKQSGHFFASANLPKVAVEISGGSWIFCEPIFKDWTSVAVGSLDGATGVKLERHIFVARKGDYYAIADGLPQNEH